MPLPSLPARVHRALFTVLFLAAVVLAAWLSQRHSLQMDWTDSARNTLTAPSRTLLARMPEPIHVRAFVSGDGRLREAVRQLVERYRRAHPRLTLEFVHPAREPRQVERLGVRQEGELVVEYRDRRQNVRGLSESLLTNALARLARAAERWVAFTAGHGERDLLGTAPRDLGSFARHLESQGLRLRPLTLGRDATVPDNVGLLVLLQPAAPWGEEQAAALEAYLARGGNLLWLAEPGAGGTPAPLARRGVSAEPGMLIDPSSRLDGRPTPEFILVQGYASHPVTSGLETFSVFPTVASIAWEAPEGWQVRGIAATGLRAWRETGDLDRPVAFDPQADGPGPLDVAVAMRRPLPDGGGEQRLVAFGDGDFLSNAYLGLGANRTLGSNALNWLAGDDVLVDVPSVMAPDLDHAPSQAARAVIALGPPLALPLALLAFGLLRGRRRRER